mmetsp:Transcript_146401/g.255731  ORF Transcript_146401/g.255731 Transcript_146401/m.255731 type:complete len:247 (+) Transcript_146401:1097-1837(+)
MSSMTTFMQERPQGIGARSNLTRRGQTSKIGGCGHPLTGGLPPGWLWPVAEAIRILPRAVQQIQVHLRILVVDAKACKGLGPDLQRALEGKIWVLLLCGLPRHHISCVPRVQSTCTFLLSQARPRRFQNGACAFLKIIQYAKECCFTKTLRLSYFVVIEVLITLHLCEPVAQFDNLGKLLCNEWPNGAHPVIASTAFIFIITSSHFRSELHRAERCKLFCNRVCVTKWHPTSSNLQITFQFTYCAP